MAITDTISASRSSTTKTQQLSDLLTTSDKLSTTTIFSRSLSDSLTISDVLNRTNDLTRSFSESMNIADSVIKNKITASSIYVDPAQTSITISSSTSTLVVTSNTAALSTITVPNTVTNSKINYSSITSGGSATIGNSLTINTHTNEGAKPEITLTIPSSTTITGTSWNGLLTLPTINTDSTLVFPVPSGKVATRSVVIDLGSSTSLTFNQPVRLLFAGESGKHVGFYHTPPTVTEITTTCTSDSISGVPSGANECQIDVGSDKVVWTKHFTGFGTYSSSSSSSTSTSVGISAGSSSSGGGGVGSTSAGPSSSESTIGQGRILSDLKILDISYDTCKTNTVKILVAYSDNNPSVILRTSIAGIVQATSAREQPFAAENENATIKKLIYEAPINSKETTFEVLALQAIGHDIYSVGKTIAITSCQGEVSFEKEQAVIPVEIDASAPRIFDVKFQLDNGTKILSSEDNHVINSQSITVYAIVDSKTTLDNVELRFVKAGDSVTSYDIVKMDTTPIQISNSTYIVSGTISKDVIKSPALTYWISVHNSAGKTIDSDSYSIGVRPNYPVIGHLELDTKMARIEGTTAHPTAYYINNSTGPVYGRIVLLVNDTIAYASPSQIFTTGQNVINLEWKTPTIGKISQYHIQARAEIYEKSIDTISYYVITFPGTVSIPISKIANVVDISVGNNTIAKASTLYSSFKNDGTMRFKVTTSDGTCIIGVDSDCLVTKSTLGLAGNFKTITVGDQIYRVRYSGPSDALERFSITSVDSMSGKWKVEIDSTNGLLPSAHAMDDVSLKVKYRAVELPFVSENQ
jgi:hypothetical protein